ncbi:MAG: gluconate 2-dehydrogenase subunit 3 family protein [Acetobacteraceae bacterium]|nr:gluconate 2-dehydrogenase subunit 3 family protein [Acetobacteraceae bacterium]
MTGRYPDYDVLAKRDTPSWNDVTRRTVYRRLDLPRMPRYFSEAEWRTLGAVCDRIMPQPSGRERIPLPALVDAKIFERHEDGYRLASMPGQGEAWKRGLAALDAEARTRHELDFASLGPDDQDALLRAMQKGELTHDAWGGMPSKAFFEHRVIADVTHCYYSHPIAWNEIGFGGPASPRGYVRMGLNRRDPWEGAEAAPGEQAEARRINQRVG